VATARYDVVLDATEKVAERPFTDPAWTRRDADVLRRMLAREREAVRTWPSAAPARGFLRDLDESGHRHWLAVPDVPALLRARDVTVVGFFGQSRGDVDHTVLFELEEQVASAFPRYSRVGLLSYYDMELDDRSYGYGNLILFSTPDVPSEWYRNEAHERAVAISPQHYRSVRLHKGSLPGRFLGDANLTIERSKYLDFSSDPPWRGLRLFRRS
jgi:hypothetical protein